MILAIEDDLGDNGEAEMYKLAYLSIGGKSADRNFWLLEDLKNLGTCVNDLPGQLEIAGEMCPVFSD